MLSGFVKNLHMLLKGRDVGLRPDYNLTGGIPPRMNREQRRAEFKGIKSRKY